MAVIEPTPQEIDGVMVYSYSSTDPFVYIFVIDIPTYNITGGCEVPTPENPTVTVGGIYKLFVNEDTSQTGKNALTDAVNAYTSS